MWSTLTIASLGLGASASVIVPHILPRGGPEALSFKLEAHGKRGGPIGQLGDGQNRFGGNLPLGEFTLKYGPQGGEIIDGKGRGCILTPPTTQFQCDEGAKPTPGFDVGCDNKLLYQGSPKFSACPVDDHGVWNIYVKPAPNQQKCIPITLTVDGDFATPPSCTKPAPCGDKSGHHDNCKPAPPPPSPPTECDHHDECKPAPPSPPPSKCDDKKGGDKDKCVPPAPKPTPSKNTCSEKPKDQDGCKPSCPTDLNGQYEFPHLIVAVDKWQPEKAFGNTFNGTTNDHVCTAYSFDVHPRFAGQQCSLIFLFPEQQYLETSAYSFSASSNSPTMQFYKVHGSIDHDTTWNSLGEMHLAFEYGIYPGKNILAFTEGCPAGQRVTAMLCGKGFSLEYFQDFNPSPIGLYIRAC